MPDRPYDYRVVYIYSGRAPKITRCGSREYAEHELASIDMDKEKIWRAWIERRPLPRRWRELSSTVREAPELVMMMKERTDAR